MDVKDVPPSYDDINPSLLDLLPPYLTTSTLLDLCLVSHVYYDSFIPFLWGSPASHFRPISHQSHSSSRLRAFDAHSTDTYDDTVYDALTRFKQVLRVARLSTRRLCHTFHLPPAYAAVYDIASETWLRELLDGLPALQSLSVSALPFFDHHSLVAVNRATPGRDSTDNTPGQQREYPLKLLLASNELNATAVGLSLLVSCLARLVYLDLSHTTAARDTRVLSRFNVLHGLRVLKLRGTGLRDAEVEILAQATGLRVRLLDLAENAITDIGLRSLRQKCFWVLPAQSRLRLRAHIESCPVGVAPPSEFLSLDIVRNIGLDGALFDLLTKPLTGRLALEDIPPAGITHLYLSGNADITVEGICTVLDSGRLHVLDVGEINITQADFSSLQHSWKVSGSTTTVARNSRVGSLETIEQERNTAGADGIGLKNYVSNKRRFLEVETLLSTLQEKAGANLTYLRINHTVVTLGLDVDKLCQNRSNTPREKKSVDVDEAVLHGHPGILKDPIETKTDLEASRQKSIESQVDSLVLKRITNASTRLHPSSLPSIHTLVLTDIPSHIPQHDTTILQNLKAFIDACADESHLARLKVAADYSLPPGRRAEQQRRAARNLFSLQTIVLEVVDVSDLNTQRDQKKTGSRLRIQPTGTTYRSCTEDIDGENLWIAGENDFSFFGRDDEDVAEELYKHGIYNESDEDDQFVPSEEASRVKTAGTSTMNIDSSHKEREESVHSGFPRYDSHPPAAAGQTKTHASPSSTLLAQASNCNNSSSSTMNTPNGHTKTIHPSMSTYTTHTFSIHSHNHHDNENPDPLHPPEDGPSPHNPDNKTKIAPQGQINTNHNPRSLEDGNRVKPSNEVVGSSTTTSAPSDPSPVAAKATVTTTSSSSSAAPTPAPGAPKSWLASSSNSTQMIDVIADLAVYRRARREEYLALHHSRSDHDDTRSRLAGSNLDRDTNRNGIGNRDENVYASEYVPGYWAGEVTVERRLKSKSKSRMRW